MLLADVADPLDLSRSLDGLMISGGADIDPSYYDEEPLQSTRCVPKERTDFEIALVRTIIELGKPVFGICYGMQLLNVAFGGALYQDLNTQFGVTVDHGRGEHMITGEGRHISGSFKVNSSHHQGVRELGKGLASCCYSADGLIEAITLPAYPFLLGVQWHPERSGDVVALSGGADWTRQRERAILGAPPGQMQYYRPRGHNSKAGDCFPLFHDGTYHLFYLILRRNMHSKWDGGHGGLEIFHASTRDLVHWKHHPVAVPISEQWEAWNGNGNTVFHNGKFRMFYPTPDYDGQRGGIQLATSDDGEHFTKHPRHPFLPGGDCEGFADPDPQKKTVHLLKAGKTSGSGLPELGDKTLVAWVSPADLDQQGAGVLTVEGAGGQAGQFDSLVLGEAALRRWMAGSDNFRRTQRDQRHNAEETAKPGEWLQLAAVYAGNTVTLYRNGSRDARYDIENPLHFAVGGRVLVGLRHLDRRDDPKAHFQMRESSLGSTGRHER